MSYDTVRPCIEAQSGLPPLRQELHFGESSHAGLDINSWCCDLSRLGRKTSRRQPEKGGTSR